MIDVIKSITPSKNFNYVIYRINFKLFKDFVIQFYNSVKLLILDIDFVLIRTEFDNMS